MVFRGKHSGYKKTFTKTDLEMSEKFLCENQKHYTCVFNTMLIYFFYHIFQRSPVVNGYFEPPCISIATWKEVTLQYHSEK